MMLRRFFQAIENQLSALYNPAPLPRTVRLLFCFSVLTLLSAPLLAQTIPPSRHVVLVIEENQQFSDVRAQMTWLSNTGNQYGYAANYQADTVGSLMDYLWLSSGSCEGASCDPSAVPPGTGGDPTNHFGCDGGGCTDPITDENIFHILSANGLTWKEYMEDYPGWPGDDSGAYVKRHNPAAWYQVVIGDPNLQANIVNFAPNFSNDANSNNLPNYSIVVPNLNNDAHDGTFPMSLQTADAWLQTNIEPILFTKPFQPGGDGVLIITFDECDAAVDGNCSSGQEHIYTAVIGPQVHLGFISNTPYKHENVLRTILELLGMNIFPLASGDPTTPMADFFGHQASNVDDMTFTCDSPCSGASSHDTTNQLDGSSLKAAYLGGSPFSDAIFHTTPNIDITSTTSFTMDFWAMVSNPAAPWVLEFSLIVDLNGQEFAFEHQCDFQDSTMWRVWNPGNGNGSWVSTGVGCAPFTGGWNHFTLEFSKNANNQLVYTAIVINGTTYPWNSGLVFDPIPTSRPNGATFQTRLVGDGTPTPYTVWIDGWNLN